MGEQVSCNGRTRVERPSRGQEEQEDSAEAEVGFRREANPRTSFFERAPVGNGPEKKACCVTQDPRRTSKVLHLQQRKSSAGDFYGYPNKIR